VFRFYDSDHRRGALGALTGFGVSLISSPFLKYVIPIVAAGIIAIAIGKFDHRLKNEYGVLGSGVFAGLLYLLQPVQDTAENLIKGGVSLFSSFLLTVFGYFASHALVDLRNESSEENNDGDFSL
jgi:hypothetical protein